MSASALMNLGTRAMFAAQAQIATTSHNIANASVAGYSRQEVKLTTTDGQYTGAGFFGRGVTVETVTRATNSFLTNQAAQTTAAAAADQALLGKLRLLEGSFGTGEDGLAHATSLLINAFADVAANPADLSARQVVLSRANALASQFRSTSDQIESLQTAVVTDVRAAVKSVNEMAQQVARINHEIAGLAGTGQSPNDLVDKRDQLVNQISAQIAVTRLQNGDGSVSLFIGGGQSLVLGSTAYQLKAVDDPYDASRVRVAISIGGEDRALAGDTLGGGAIAGMLQFQDDDLATMRAELGRLAAALGSAVNDRQALGLDLAGGTGGPLFSFGATTSVATRVLPDGGNAKVAGNYVGEVSLTIADASALQASDYQLREDPAAPGLYQVTRLSDGRVTSGVADGATIDGFTVHIDAPPQPGDTYLLQPVSTAARAFSLNQSDPRSIAAANLLSVTAGAANAGTAGVAALTMTAPPATPYAAMSLVFTSSAGDYELRDGGGGVLQSGTWTAGSAIAHDGFTLTLTGAPKAGDTFALAPTTDVRSSNGNALAAVGLAREGIVGGDTFTDAFANMLADLGTRVLGSSIEADASAAVASRTQQALGADTGVNLDEEAARLMQYQQSYQAAAKILQVAQKVFDTILELGR